MNPSLSTMSLRNKLSQVKSRDLYGREFISRSALRQLITVAATKWHLVWSCKVDPEPTIVESIVQNASQLFAILIMISEERFVSKAIKQGWCDDKLPLSEADVQYFRDLRISRCFMETQWLFPPVFRSKSHLELPGNAALPFTDREFLGDGAFGVVVSIKVAEGHLPEHNTDVVAWKRIRPRANQSWKVVMREVETLRERRHRFIVPLLASFTLGQFESEEASLNLLFPCARMNMHQWLRLTKSPEEPQCLGFDGQRKYLYSSIFSLVSALSFLHRPIDGKVTSHHDLKPHNILFLDGTLKICDFGRTHLMDWSTGSETAGEHGLGTPTYHPPEFYNDDGSRSSVNHGRSFDIWSMGCIIIEIATLILYGWEAGKVQEFQNKRLDSEPQRWKKIDDDSFHNNMDCVRAWVSEMRGHDESSPQFVRTLTIADRMLRENPEDRLYSWESELDLYELLYPDLPNSHRAQTEAPRVQGPRQKKFVRRVETPLHRACMDENEHRVRKLLLAGWPTEVKDSMGHTALQIAESRGWNRLVRILSAPATQLQQSHSERAEQSPYDSRSRKVQGFFLDEIDDGGDGKTALHYAAEKGLQYDVEKILATTPNKWRVISAEDDEGLTPLHWAARKGHKDVLDTLLPSDGHKTEDYLHKVDNSGQTLLHHACYFGHTDVALLLLEKYQPHGNSVAALLAKDVAGKTPLHWAAQRGHLETVEALIMAGTSMETLQRMLEERDDNGKDACQLAQRAEVVDLLQGARQKGTGTVKYHTHR